EQLDPEPFGERDRFEDPADVVGVAAFLGNALAGGGARGLERTEPGEVCIVAGSEHGSGEAYGGRAYRRRSNGREFHLVFTSSVVVKKHPLDGPMDFTAGNSRRTRRSCRLVEYGTLRRGPSPDLLTSKI